MRLLRHVFAPAVCCAAAAMALGCHPHIYESKPNPFTDIKVFAVAPILGVKENQIPAGSEPLEDIFADQLANFPKVEFVVRASQIRKIMESLRLERLSSAEDALRVLREAKADAIIVMEVLNVNLMPNSMRATVALQMFTARKFDPRSIDWKAMETSPKPFALPEEYGRRPITGFQKVFDTTNMDTQERIKYFASAHDTSKRGLGDEIFSKVFVDFFRFVSYELVLEIWEREIRRLERLSAPAAPAEEEGKPK